MNLKLCTYCNLEKDIDEFSKNKATKDKLQYYCKSCVKIRVTKFRENNPNYNKTYYHQHKDEISKTKKEKYKLNKDNLKNKSKEYYLLNKECVLEKKKSYLKQYRKINKSKIDAYKSRYNKNRRKTDLLFKLKTNLRSSMYRYIKFKNKKTVEYLGCSYQEFRVYIESLWEPWMNWDNYGNPKDGIIEPNKTWDLDHIIPLVNAKTEEDVIKLCHYTNYQPLCSYVNRITKRDK